MRYYHITTFEGWLKTREEGIKADDDGYIYLLTTKKANILSHVAWNQLGLKDYGLISIKSEGILAELELDKVGEITAEFQRRIKQPLIEPKYIARLNMYKIIKPFKVGEEIIH